ncbi:MAG: efflux RND transporter periplasmic adaptor subunit [Gemmatimonadota bacterium]
MSILRRFLPLLVVLAVASALYVGYRRIASRPPLVEVTEARTEDVVRVLAVTGRIKPRLANQVQPLVSGTILTLTRVEGAAVRRGEVLATMDAQTSRASIQQASAQLTAQRTEVEQRARDYDRARRLADAGGLAPREAEAAKSDLDAARESVRQLEALVRESRSRLRDFTLVSPIDGYVLSRPVDPGQNVTPQTIIYELATATDPEIEVEIDEQYLSELRVGLEATVSPLTGARRQYSAKVTNIGRRVSESSGAVPVRLEFIGEAPRLPAGLSVDVNLMIATHRGATTVSRAAVAGLGADPHVMLVRSDTLVRQPVQVIDWPSPRIVVINGVKAGDLVVLTPRMVRAGLTVRTKLVTDAF